MAQKNLAMKVARAAGTSLAELSNLANHGDQYACDLLLEITSDLTRRVNEAAMNEPRRFEAAARRMTAWPVLKSPVPDFCVPSEAKPWGSRSGKKRLTRVQHRASDADDLFRQLNVGADHALTWRGKRTRAVTNDPLGRLVLAAINEIEQYRPFLSLAPLPGLSERIAKLPPLRRRMTWGEANAWGGNSKSMGCGEVWSRILAKTFRHVCYIKGSPKPPTQ
jgi:hypothetical protein